MYLKSGLLSRIPGVTHGFGSEDEEIPAPFAELWPRAKPTWKQVHGTTGVEVGTPAQSCGEVDALWTARPGAPIAVVSADCVPVLLTRRDGGRVAAVHAGWRGTFSGILPKLFEELKARGERPSEWCAAIGPAIGPCCYEVSPELARDFERVFASIGKGLAVPIPRRLDLPAINASTLRALGLFEVELLRACTRCSMEPGGARSRPLFHSFRREGGGTRQYSMIMLDLDPSSKTLEGHPESTGRPVGGRPKNEAAHP